MGPFFSRKVNLPVSLTLIEFIMVVVIIGILVMLAIPRFDVYYSLKLQGAGKKLVSDIRYLQNFALSRHTNTRVVFDVAGNSYQASWCNASCSVESNWQAIKDPFTHSNLEVDYDTESRYGGVSVFSVDFGGTTTLRFNWEGVPQDGGGSSLTSAGSVVLSCRGEQLTIEVTPQTGRVSILRIE